MLCSSLSHAIDPDSLFAYDSAWSLSGPCCGDSGDDLAVANDGSYFIAGSYGKLDLDRDGVAEMQAEGGHDALLLKFAASGEMRWMGLPRSPSGIHSMQAVAVDRKGGAYMVGVFQEHLTLSTGETINSRGRRDGFLIRYSSTGEPLWARAIGGSADDSIADVATDARGNVYVIASVRGVIDLVGATPQASGQTNGANMLVTSFDPNGRLRWSQLSSGTGDTFGQAITVSAKGNVFVTGDTRSGNGEIDFDDDGINDLPADTNGVTPFLVSFNPAGHLSWVRAITGPSTGGISDIDLKPNGSLLVLGAVSGEPDFDGDGVPETNVAVGSFETFVMQMSHSGDLQWFRTFTGGKFWHLTAGAKRIVLSGFYNMPLDFDGDGQQDGDTAVDGEGEGLIVSLDHTGTLQQILTIVGPSGDQVRATGLSPDGKTLWATGFVRLTADFNADGQYESSVRCDSRGDIFGARYKLQH